MKKLIDAILIIGFIAVDFFFLHDILKPEETVTFAQYLTVFLSLLVIYESTLTFIKR